MREFLSILAVGAVMALAWALWRLVAWLREPAPTESNVVGGRRLLTEQQARALAERDAGAGGDPRRYEWGSVSVSPKAALTHFFAVGTSGSGKTIVLRKLLRSVVHQLGRDERCVIFDIKGDYWEFLQQHCSSPMFDPARDVMRLHPFVEGTPAWDIARDASPTNAPSVCAGLLPLGSDKDSSHFVNATRQMMTLVMDAFRALGGDWSLWDLVVACNSAKNLRELARASGLTEIIDRLSDRNPETGSVVGSLSTATDCLRAPAAIWNTAHVEGQKFSIAEWMEGRGPRVLVIGFDTSKRASMERVTQMLMSRIISQLLSLKSKGLEDAPRTWLFLDELPFAGRIEELLNCLNAGRSQGIAAVLGTQTMLTLQLPSHYPHGEAAAIVANARNRAYLRPGDDDTAQWIGKQIGKQLLYETGYSSGQTHDSRGGNSSQAGEDHRIQERFAVNPDELKDLPLPQADVPMTGVFEIDQGVWIYTMPPSEFPDRPEPRDSRTVPEDAVPPSIKWTPEDRMRLRLPPERSKPEPDSEVVASDSDHVELE